MPETGWRLPVMQRQVPNLMELDHAAEGIAHEDLLRLWPRRA